MGIRSLFALASRLLHVFCLPPYYKLAMKACLGLGILSICKHDEQPGLGAKRGVHGGYKRGGGRLVGCTINNRLDNSYLESA